MEGANLKIWNSLKANGSLNAIFAFEIGSAFAERLMNVLLIIYAGVPYCLTEELFLVKPAWLRHPGLRMIMDTMTVLIKTLIITTLLRMTLFIMTLLIMVLL